MRLKVGELLPQYQREHTLRMTLRGIILALEAALRASPDRYRIESVICLAKFALEGRRFPPEVRP